MPFCPKCGNQVKDGDRFCPVCGQQLSAAAVQPAAPPQVPEQRPTGVTILALLEALGGLLFFGAGVLLLVAAGIVRGLGLGLLRDGRLFPILTSAIVGVVAIVVLVIGVVDFIIAYGLWTGRGWAWTLGMVFAGLGILLGLVTLPGGIVRLFLDGVIIYYLTRLHVKRFFGREPITLTI